MSVGWGIVVGIAVFPIAIAVVVAAVYGALVFAAPRIGRRCAPAITRLGRAFGLVLGLAVGVVPALVSGDRSVVGVIATGLAAAVVLAPLGWSGGRRMVAGAFRRSEWPLAIGSAASVWVFYALNPDVCELGVRLFAALAVPYVFYLGLAGVIGAEPDGGGRSFARFAAFPAALVGFAALRMAGPWGDDRSAFLFVGSLAILWTLVALADLFTAARPDRRAAVFGPFERAGRAAALFALVSTPMVSVILKVSSELGRIGYIAGENGVGPLDLWLFGLWAIVLPLGLYAFLYGPRLPRPVHVGAFALAVLFAVVSASVPAVIAHGLAEIIGVAVAVGWSDTAHGDTVPLGGRVVAVEEAIAPTPGTGMRESTLLAHALWAATEARWWRALPAADLSGYRYGGGHENPTGTGDGRTSGRGTISEEYLVLGWHHLRWGGLDQAVRCAEAARAMGAEGDEAAYLEAEAALRRGDTSAAGRLPVRWYSYDSSETDPGSTSNLLTVGRFDRGAVPFYPALRRLSVLAPGHRDLSNLSALPIPDAPSGLPDLAGPDVRRAAASALALAPAGASPLVRDRWVRIGRRLVADAEAAGDASESARLRRALSRLGAAS